VQKFDEISKVATSRGRIIHQLRWLRSQSDETILEFAVSLIFYLSYVIELFHLRDFSGSVCGRRSIRCCSHAHFRDRRAEYQGLARHHFPIANYRWCPLCMCQSSDSYRNAVKCHINTLQSLEARKFQVLSRVCTYISFHTSLYGLIIRTDNNNNRYY